MVSTLFLLFLHGLRFSFLAWFPDLTPIVSLQTHGISRSLVADYKPLVVDHAFMVTGFAFMVLTCTLRAVGSYGGTFWKFHGRPRRLSALRLMSLLDFVLSVRNVH